MFEYKIVTYYPKQTVCFHEPAFVELLNQWGGHGWRFVNVEASENVGITVVTVLLERKMFAR